MDAVAGAIARGTAIDPCPETVCGARRINTIFQRRRIGAEDRDAAQEENPKNRPRKKPGITREVYEEQAPRLNTTHNTSGMMHSSKRIGSYPADLQFAEGNGRKTVVVPVLVV